MTMRALLIIPAVSILGDLRERSIPRSLIASITTGLTRPEGTVPALDAFNPSFPANAWAIWLRPAFSHRRTGFLPSRALSITLEEGFLARGLKVDPKKRPQP